MKFPGSVNMAELTASVASLSQKVAWNSSALRLSVAAAVILIGLYLYILLPSIRLFNTYGRDGDPSLEHDDAINSPSSGYLFSCLIPSITSTPPSLPCTDGTVVYPSWYPLDGTTISVPAYATWGCGLVSANAGSSRSNDPELASGAFLFLVVGLPVIFLAIVGACGLGCLVSRRREARRDRERVQRVGFGVFEVEGEGDENLVWDLAAALSPLIHFLHRDSNYPTIAQSSDSELLLVPDRHSGALNLVHLTLACWDAHAAVVRRNRALRNKSILRAFRTKISHGYGGSKTLYLNLDLRSDVVCLGGADAGRGEADAVLDWAESSHIMFTGARRFAIRYQAEWDVNLRRGVVSEHLRPNCLHASGAVFTERRPEEGEEAERMPGRPFCARCMTNVLRRFERLESVYLVVDGGDESSTANGSKKFHGYSRTYFEMVGVEGCDELRGPVVALQVLRESLIAAQRSASTPTWAEDMKFALLGWREENQT
ncbi:hypothetical protein B0T17DRAFT_617482 [Bombardia bombarda]|uniref:Uncharacterized protein n=1 Tax=Bombardia bombarda TaxID=252184 RepID=A0AA40C4S6_9PEZI|nr:hypothetical protein B0T17DRAFT_617482 [Bombardia bombarda]